MNCFACHVKARPEFDFVCESPSGHACHVRCIARDRSALRKENGERRGCGGSAATGEIVEALTEKKVATRYRATNGRVAKPPPRRVLVWRPRGVVHAAAFDQRPQVVGWFSSRTWSWIPDESRYLPRPGGTRYEPRMRVRSMRSRLCVPRSRPPFNGVPGFAVLMLETKVVCGTGREAQSLTEMNCPRQLLPL